MIKGLFSLSYFGKKILKTTKKLIKNKTKQK